MSGTKTITNNSSVTLTVILIGRVGEPIGPTLPPVATIKPQSSVTLQYGNAQSPFLKTLQ